MNLTRRRFLTIAATAIAAPSFALASQSARWQGRAMGAPASLVLAGLTSEAAQPIFAAFEAELDRLDRLFSLFRPDSTLVQLNQTGRLVAPPPEFFDVIDLSDRLNKATGGAFDPTVQPLLQAGMMARARARVFGLIGWDKVKIDAREISFERAGMALTLNGIARGYVTDRIAAFLRAEGLTDVLIDIGELQAIGRNPIGNTWKARINSANGEYDHHVALCNRALATTKPMGVRKSDDGVYIVCPNGHRPRHKIVSVSSPSAAVADGLSTAIALMRREHAIVAVEKFPGTRIEMIA